MGDHDYADDERKRREQAADENRQRQEIANERLFKERVVPGGRILLSQPSANLHGAWLPATQGVPSAAIAIEIMGHTNYGFIWQGTALPREATGGARELRGGVTLESPGQKDSNLLKALGLFPLVIRFGPETLVIALPADAITRINDATAPKPGG